MIRLSLTRDELSDLMEALASKRAARQERLDELRGLANRSEQSERRLSALIDRCYALESKLVKARDGY